MNDLQSIQNKLGSNLAPGFFTNYLQERVNIINKWTKFKPYSKTEKIPYSPEDKQPWLDSGPQLTEFMMRYAKIAMDINPIILEYNKIAEDTLVNHPTELAQLNEIALDLVKAYSNTEFNELRKAVGVMKLKRRIWLKMDVPYRNQLYKNLDQASNMLKEANKMRKRKKRLDAKVSYPYWLW